jgi:hypothetical protein
MRLEHLRPFVTVLEDEFYIDDEMIAELIQQYSSFNIIHRETMFKCEDLRTYLNSEESCQSF